MGKGEIAHYEQFLVFPHCFFPFGELLPIFINLTILVYQVFQFGSLKIVVWERVNSISQNLRKIQIKCICRGQIYGGQSDIQVCW